MIVVLILSLLVGTVEARDRAVVRAFQAQNECPAIRDGKCLYDIDHKIALVCGGPDTVENLAYLNRESHKIKSRFDVKRCRGTWYGFWMRLWRDVQFWK
jgi:hypothetical protein